MLREISPYSFNFLTRSCPIRGVCFAPSRRSLRRAIAAVATVRGLRGDHPFAFLIIEDFRNAVYFHSPTRID